MSARVLTQKCELGLLDPDLSPIPPVLRSRVGESGDIERSGVSEGGAELRDEASKGADSMLLAEAAPGSVDLDTAENRSLACWLAEQSVVLLGNASGILPLRAERSGKIALVGPLADEQAAMLGFYSFPAHVGPQHPHVPIGVRIPTILEALREELPEALREELTVAGICAETGYFLRAGLLPAAGLALPFADACHSSRYSWRISRRLWPILR
jgi:beta-xylosidase